MTPRREARRRRRCRAPRTSRSARAASSSASHDLHDSCRKDRSAVARDRLRRSGSRSRASGSPGPRWGGSRPWTFGRSLEAPSGRRGSARRVAREDSSHDRGLAARCGSASPPQAHRRARDDARRPRFPGEGGPGRAAAEQRYGRRRRSRDRRRARRRARESGSRGSSSNGSRRRAQGRAARPRCLRRPGGRRRDDRRRTLAACRAAGIGFMGTGGIGGVHRGERSTSPATSASSARTEALVVCSGCEVVPRRPGDDGAARDARRTRLGYRTDELAALLHRAGGPPVPARSRAPTEGGRDRAHALGLRHSALVLAQPPRGARRREPLIEQARAAAGEQGISGPALTPYVLAPP